MGFCLGLAVSLKIILHSVWKLIRFWFGWPWASSFKSELHSNWKLIRFWLGLALNSFLEIPITFMRFWLGLALSSFFEIPITFLLKIDEILASWAGSAQFSWNSYYILIKNWWDSGLVWPWAVSLKFLSHANILPGCLARLAAERGVASLRLARRDRVLEIDEILA